MEEIDKKKIMFVVPDGTGIKNYLFSDLLKYLVSKGAEVLVYHNLHEKAIVEIKIKHQVAFESKKMIPYKAVSYTHLTLPTIA